VGAKRVHCRSGGLVMILFENARLWDGFAEEFRPGLSVLV
jgi:hypothetical protein